MKAPGKFGKAGLVLASAALVAFLSVWEPGKNPGLVYADQLAGGLPTVCNGITRHVTATPVIVGEQWSPEKCAQEEAAAIVAMQLRLLQCFRLTPPQSVLDAASSHAWNFGVGKTCGSAAMSAWNRGDWSLGCRRLWKADDGRPVWSYVSDGKGGYRFVRGLANRRQAEARMCTP